MTRGSTETDSDPASPVYSENGVDADLDGDLESAWFQGGGGTLDPVAGGGPGAAPHAPSAGSSVDDLFHPRRHRRQPAPRATGKVTWVFTPTSASANTSQDFRFARR